LVYGAAQLGSYLYNGKTAEENIGKALGFKETRNMIYKILKPIIQFDLSRIKKWSGREYSKHFSHHLDNFLFA